VVLSHSFLVDHRQFETQIDELAVLPCHFVGLSTVERPEAVNAALVTFLRDR
jgi:hypothetical protein